MIGLAYAVYNKYQDWQSSKIQPVEVQRIVEEPQVQQNFSCDGRQHCSQMGSYEEALYFLKIVRIPKWMVTAMVFHVKANLDIAK